MATTRRWKTSGSSCAKTARDGARSCSIEAEYQIEEGTRPLLDGPVPLLTIDLPFLAVGGAYAFESHDEPQRDFLRKAGIQP